MVFMFSVFLLTFKNLLGLSLKDSANIFSYDANLTISTFSYVKFSILCYEVQSNLGLLCLPGELILSSLQSVPGCSPCDLSLLQDS